MDFDPVSSSADSEPSFENNGFHLIVAVASKKELPSLPCVPASQPPFCHPHLDLAPCEDALENLASRMADFLFF